GVDTGVNTSIGWPGDNNDAPAFHGGIGLNLLDGSLTILATTHIGPEIPKQLDPLGVGWPNTPVLCGCDPNNTLRYLNDVTVTWKPTENLTFITDLNYITDGGFNVDPITGRGQGVRGYGGAQYAIYKINDILKIVGRGEIWRDQNGFFVAAFPHSLDFINAEHGFPATVIAVPPIIPGGPTPGTTYAELTAGLTISPPIEKNPLITGITFRPEVRWDTSLNGTSPFAAGTRHSQVTFGLDIIAPFTIR
ncbi:MAG: outer membrane beta-barrel protein, partial [Methylocystis sp.]|nr:outer membrane beta-barrel protein [Methylocystis sp.]